MSVRDEIAALVDAAARAAQAAGELPQISLPEPAIERPSRPEHGDYASSLPLRLSRAARSNPIQIANVIAKRMSTTEAIGAVDVAPPGFINIRLDDAWLTARINDIIAAGDAYASSDLFAGKKLQLEFVSANPTGPLHLGNGRWASIGDSLARVFEAAGYYVEREYLVNDAGTQSAVFAETVLARYKQLFGVDAELPANGYPGEYVIDVAQAIKDEVGDRYLEATEVPAELRKTAIDKMIERIRSDLTAIGVNYDVWFYESSLFEDGTYETAMDLLRERGAVVQKEGATWFASSALGEDKDNVLIRSNGAPTYFASDIAYHYDKLVKRGFDKAIDIWGADHQGHVSRVKTAVHALGVEEGRLEIIIGQLVGLKRGGETVRFSKRANEIITLREVVDEVGADACRFFFLQRSADSQMEFDVDLAKTQDSANPVYYVQYGHARIAGILSQAAERGISYDDANIDLLRHPSELALVRKMLVLPELVEQIAENYEPHHLPHYALDLATHFHDFYEKCRVLDDEQPELTKARLRLAAAAKVVLARSLSLMGMSAPERM